MLRVLRSGVSLALAAMLAIAGMAVVAPRADAEPTTVDVCVRSDLDYRAPYADGRCPTGFREVTVSTVAEGGQAVCVKTKTDWRAPYKDGTCPSGYALVRVATVATGGELACFKPGYDVRAPDKVGCPSGWTPVRLSAVTTPTVPVVVETRDSVNHSFSFPETVTGVPVRLEGSMNDQAFDRDFWQINQPLTAGLVIHLTCTAPQPYEVQAMTDQLVLLGSIVCDGAPHDIVVPSDRPFWLIAVTNDLSASGGTALPPGAYAVTVSIT